MKKYYGSVTYKKGMLNVIEDSQREKFTMSSPSKVSKKHGRAFSLPAGPEFSCPGATEACIDCYAQKGRHYFKKVQSVMASNWNIFQEFEREHDVIGCAELIIESLPKKGLFRIHESGDFHSQFAVDVWEEVVAANPHIDFYSYTRSFHLNFNSLLKHQNFLLWASTDKFNAKQAKKFVTKYKKKNVKHAFGPWEKGVSIPDNSFICPATNNKIDIVGACEKCQLCIQPNKTKKNVVFLIH